MSYDWPEKVFGLDMDSGHDYLCSSFTQVSVFTCFKSSLLSSQMAHQAGAYPGFSAIEATSNISPLSWIIVDGILVHRRVNPSSKFADAVLPR